jgi:hypothetical protein
MGNKDRVELCALDHHAPKLLIIVGAEKVRS